MELRGYYGKRMTGREREREREQKAGDEKGDLCTQDTQRTWENRNGGETERTTHDQILKKKKIGTFSD